MPRAVNVDASRSDVLIMCNKHDLRISAIESLQPAGTRVVLYNIDDTAVLRKLFAGKIITGTVRRVPLRAR